MAQCKNKKCFFSLSKADIFFINNFIKIVILPGLAIVLACFYIQPMLIYRLFKDLIGVSLVAFIIILCFASIKFMSKCTYKIDIDFDSENLCFYMLRTNNIITKSFSELKKIRVNGYIIFRFQDRTIYYNGFLSNDLLECINKIERIEWGALTILFGPNRNIRQKLTCQKNNKP